jgi:3-phenylpropionate/cinnamic acid dioxygenase small subunit
MSAANAIMPANAITLEAATALIWLEADLLDRRDYQEWLALWADEAYYVIPLDHAATDYANTLNVAYDDANMRRMRVARLSGKQSMSVNAVARTLRTVSRFRIIGSDTERCRLRCAQILVEHRADGDRLYSADLDYTLVATNVGLRIKEKVIRLINAGDALHGIGYLL